MTEQDTILTPLGCLDRDLGGMHLSAPRDSAAAPQVSNLLAMPQELLDNIYIFLPLSSARHVRLGPRQDTLEPQDDQSREAGRCYTALSRTCRKLRHDIAPLFWSQNTFEIYHGIDSTRDICIDPAHLCFVSDLTLQSGAEDIGLTWKGTYKLALKIRRQHEAGLSAQLDLVSTKTGYRSTIALHEIAEGLRPGWMRRSRDVQTRSSIREVAEELVANLGKMQHMDDEILRLAMTAFTMLQRQVFE